jgi:hypothetical protein
MNGNSGAARAPRRTTVRRAGDARWFRKAAAAAALLCIGCAQQSVRAPEPAPRPAPPPVNLSGYSAAFKEGFQAGCDTARGRSHRDESRMQSDAQYAQGWQDGRSICAKR